MMRLTLRIISSASIEKDFGHGRSGGLSASSETGHECPPKSPSKHLITSWLGRTCRSALSSPRWSVLQIQLARLLRLRMIQPDFEGLA